jgi:DNA-binding CsgD family transcriptional regulator
VTTAEVSAATAVSAADGILEDMSSRVTSPVFVGRAEQLATLDDALATAGSGDPAAVLIGGEAGVGKSRLVSEWSGRAAAGGARVLTGGCLELGTDGLPFAPFTAVLRELVRELGADGVAALLPGGAARELCRLLPDLGEAPASGADGYPGEARGRLFEQMLTLLEHLAEEASQLVLVVEDAHWADRSTRDLLSFLTGNQRLLDGVLIVVTFRSDELHRTHPLRHLLAELGRISWLERIELPRLTRHEATVQMAAILGREPESAQLDDLFRRSEGNPLFVEELLSCDGRLPESLRDLVLASVQRLPAETQELLRVVSAGGEQVGHSLLARASGLADDLLTGTLRAAVAGNVLVAGSDGYVLRHALIREALYDDLLPGERSRLHARFAEAIAADPALVPDGRPAIKLANHWYAAHDVSCALTSAWRAAGEAAQGLALAEQLSMLARVLELWDKVPDAAQQIGRDHLGVLEEATRVAHLIEDDDRGFAFASAALQEVDAAAEPARAAALLEQRSDLKCHTRQQDNVRDLREALRLVADGRHEAQRRRVLASLSHALHRDQRTAAEARRAAAEALALARESGDGATEASALLVLAMTPCSPRGGPDDALALIAEARAAAERADDYQLTQLATIDESHLLEGMGAHERAAEVARSGLTAARAQGVARTSGAFLTINLAEPLFALGHWEEASEVIENALDLGSAASTRASLRQLAGDIALAQGDLASAASSAAASAELLVEIDYYDQHHLPLWRLQIELSAANARLADALATVQNVLDGNDLRPSPRYAWPLVVTAVRACAEVLSLPVPARDETIAGQAAALLSALRAEAAELRADGKLQRAHQMTFDVEAARAERIAGAVGPVTPAAGTADPAPPAASPDGGGQPARTLWQQAAAAWETVGEPYPLAIALFRGAEAALADAQNRDAAAQPLRRAAAIAKSLGAPLLLEQVSLLARRAKIPLSDDGGRGSEHASDQHPRTTGPADQLGLTGRELEVLQLVTTGRSNASIADELFISAKTVSVHVSNILAKLGVASRGEAAATAHKLRLFDRSPAA